MTDRQHASLVRAIMDNGFCGVVLVRKEGSWYVIVDGEQRWRAARELGIPEIPCLVGEFDEKRARALTVKLNQIHGYWSSGELVALLKDLPDSLEDLGFTDDEFACEVESALEDTAIGLDFDHQTIDEKRRLSSPTRRYVGFMLSPSAQRLLDRALKRATEQPSDSPCTRTRSFVSHSQGLSQERIGSWVYKLRCRRREKRPETCIPPYRSTLRCSRISRL